MIFSQNILRYDEVFQFMHHLRHLSFFQNLYREMGVHCALYTCIQIKFGGFFSFLVNFLGPFWWVFQKNPFNLKQKSGLCYVTPKLKKHTHFRLSKLDKLLKWAIIIIPLSQETAVLFYQQKNFLWTEVELRFGLKTSLSFLLLYRKQK